ncbi:SYF2 splicing factor-domain-containing protein [Sphaerosporella brunnea]|uniref:Pre-mRNA-splicing factor SYF2 n=1 Tax=Sphaerosporella brunnea TaxID=1250544 RepID=A0A5J5ERQ8_9PEZI|nr:SYF2 splicing factor-domain-containing protein [Sphaerosporella brunnea]
MPQILQTESQDSLLKEKQNAPRKRSFGWALIAGPKPKHRPPPSSAAATQADPAKARLEKWKALQTRAKKTPATNLKEVYAERRRQMMDPASTSKLQRKKAEAEFKLAKAEASEAGEDFERKRAWDWTVEESERWDRRTEKKQCHVQDVAFQDYSQTARKMYKRQMRELKPDLEAYVAEKAKLLKEGGVVETEDGELVVVDLDGEFYADADSLGFVDDRPKKEAVDRLVADLRKAEDARMSRKRGGEDDDVTNINDKNKQFNQKLQRAYGKYTKEIRDSFERGTMV